MLNNDIDFDQLIKYTIKAFKPYRKLMPSLDPKYFSRPPIKFLALTVGALNQMTGFGNGIFTEEELQGNFAEREDILNFFRNLKKYTEICLNQSIDVSVKSIAKGKEVEKTLLFMQNLAYAAENPVISFEEAAMRMNFDGYSGDEKMKRLNNEQMSEKYCYKSLSSPTKQKRDMNERNYRFYTYCIPELSTKLKTICVNTLRCTSFDDLKKAIASENHLSYYCIKFDNLPIKELKSIDKNYEFKLSLCNFQNDINISISGAPDSLNDKRKPKPTSNEIIKIIFIFTGIYSRKFYPMRESIPVDSKINNIIKIISNKYDIKDKITLKYKFNETLITIKPTSTIEEVKYLIQETNSTGRTENIIYIDINCEEEKIHIERKNKNTNNKNIKSNSSETDSEKDENQYYKMSSTYEKDKNWTPKNESRGANNEKSPKKKIKRGKRTPKKASANKLDINCEDKKEKEDISPIEKTSYIDENVEKLIYPEKICQKISPSKQPSPVKSKSKKSIKTFESPELIIDSLPISSSYTFRFNEKEEKINLENESTIESQEEKIKNILKIEKEQPITFRYIMKEEEEDFDDDDDDYEDDHEIELLITDLKRQMKEFFKGKIRITLRYKQL